MKKSTIIMIALVIFNLIACVAYSELSTNLSVEGDATLRSQIDLKISKIVAGNAVNSAQNLGCSNTVDSVKINASLPNGNSSITYEVTVSNTSDYYYVLQSKNESNSNSNVTVTTSGMETNTVYGKGDYTFYITVKPSNTSLTGQSTTFDAKYVLSLLQINYVTELSPNGGYRPYTANYNAKYRVELWGAQGGSYTDLMVGGDGGYTAGNIQLNKNETLYVYIGKQGTVGNTAGTIGGGYNGGGNAQIYTATATNKMGGGGATDLRYFTTTPSSSDLVWSSALGLRSRIMVAGGGGGTSNNVYNDSPSSAGGGIVGYAGIEFSGGQGGTQTAGGTIYNYSTSWNGKPGEFGKGGQGGSHAGGGGGGYFGGAGGTRAPQYDGSGGGGSSFISGHTGCVAVASSSSNSLKSGCTSKTTNNSCSVHYSNKVFTSTVMIDGGGFIWTNDIGKQDVMPCKDGGNNPVGSGNKGDGFARITILPINAE